MRPFFVRNRQQHRISLSLSQYIIFLSRKDSSILRCNAYVCCWSLSVLFGCLLLCVCALQRLWCADCGLFPGSNSLCSVRPYASPAFTGLPFRYPSFPHISGQYAARFFRRHLVGGTAHLLSPLSLFVSTAVQAEHVVANLKMQRTLLSLNPPRRSVAASSSRLFKLLC